MSYYLLNHLSTGELILVLVGLPTLAAMAGVFVADKAFPNLHHLEIDDTVREVVGLVFGLLLALVIANIVAKHDQADSATAAEATATAQLARATRTFPIQVQLEFEQAIGQYVHTVVNDEWPAMRTGNSSMQASAALETIYGVFQSFRPVGEPDISVYRQALVQLDQVTASRRERLDLSSQSLPGLLRLLLVFGIVSFVVLSYPTGVRDRRKKMAITGSITAFICFAYLLTVVLDHPFSGAVAISNSSFTEGDLALYWPSPAPEQVQPGDLARLTPSDVVGVWTSSAFGPTIFRDVNGEILGALRLGQGTVVARISGDVLRGTWCEAPTRSLPNKIGQVQWRMTKSRGRNLLVGGWRYGTTGPLRGGWDLTRIGGADLEPPDVVPMFSSASLFCPGIPATPGQAGAGRAPSRPAVTRPVPPRRGVSRPAPSRPAVSRPASSRRGVSRPAP